MPSRENALDMNQVAKMAGVNRNAVLSWEVEGLLTNTSPIERYHIYDKAEVDQLVEVRNRNPHNWKNEWKRKKNA